MRLARILMVAALAAPMAAWAQDCYDCVLGIWDDPALTRDRGTAAPLEPKELYVGLKLDDGIDDVSGVEFSIAGLDQGGLLLLGATPLGPRALVFGTAPAPQDTTAESTGIGGLAAAWTDCRYNGEALFKLVVFALEEVADRVLVVKRAYPTTNPSWRTPVLLRCDRPFYSAARVTGGCYVLNPSGAPVPCPLAHAVVAVEPETWSGVKQLFR
jgi:hypothetical protein